MKTKVAAPVVATATSTATTTGSPVFRNSSVSQTTSKTPGLSFDQPLIGGSSAPEAKSGAKKKGVAAVNGRKNRS
jgi:hypothetical protein